MPRSRFKRTLKAIWLTSPSPDQPSSRPWGGRGGGCSWELSEESVLQPLPGRQKLCIRSGFTFQNGALVYTGVPFSKNAIVHKSCRTSMKSKSESEPLNYLNRVDRHSWRSVAPYFGPVFPPCSPNGAKKCKMAAVSNRWTPKMKPTGPTGHQKCA